MLEIENLSVKYPDGTLAVDSLNMNIKNGERIALVGGNGAGKTSLILAVSGIIESSGNVKIDDIYLNKNNISEIRKRVGVLFQNPDDQLFMASIYEDIAFGPRNLGIDEETIEHRVDDRLKLLNIEHLKYKTALKLSGGEKRMAALATVLAMKPSVMLLDEPTAFLDPKARRNLINILKKLPHSMLIATHDLTFAQEVCENTIVLKNGKIFTEGKSSEILYDNELMENGNLEAIGKL